LLKRGARTDVRNNIGYSALMIAAHEGKANIVEALLQGGASKALRNKKREIAFDVAVGSGHADIARLLR